ncbi:serine/threonine-protein kinase RsbW [Acetivibrio thermocellus AD2]|uniref:Serine/threonine-protein kinase RsbW n=1 Tax=Acetivibrio thermocellus AD2 TaxID=1138384 RepID=A0AB36TCR9_ACETH|nr:ATP-binding protein [Acetivibrio thermocellus]ADU73531.1 ATP-binding region ATPase domain protein [Acetivibrio thermocellus DSM 1313]ALX07453.1 putative anti-sigma regulatory factor, serine/threonine protein kinase [Acetivibrio thermocellus AD2]EIC04080.1 ATP-binding region ATPase domain protein [Acetivibrio thermocellus YS]NLU27784.1 ATP-binding protein [Acetivibrio thermocellus]PFH01717.1 serine/threonine-protein kinase RsbW [Acetivibrio thermocellus AD2]
MKVLKTYNSKVSSQKENICFLVKDIMKFLSDSSDVSEDVLFEIKVILNELLQNAIKHGNKEDASKSVEVSVGITADNHVYLIVEDEGEGYDLDCVCAKEEIPEEVTDVCDLKENGRGILIVKNLCDRIRLNKKGNKVIVFKSLK